MKPTPDVSITGTATRLHVDPDTTGGIILVTYAEMPDGTVGRVWLRIPAGGIDYLRHHLPTEEPPPIVFAAVPLVGDPERDAAGVPVEVRANTIGTVLSVATHVARFLDPTTVRALAGHLTAAAEIMESRPDRPAVDTGPRGWFQNPITPPVSCTPACWTPVTCPQCGRSVPPRGRSVPLEMSPPACCSDLPPKANPRHLWTIHDSDRAYTDPTGWAEHVAGCDQCRDDDQP
jgi:hypothetical protein